MCKQYSKNFSHNKEKINWINLVIDEKRNILSLEKDPIKMLMKIFELCIDNFDKLSLKEKHKDLYECLLTLYLENEKKPLINSLEENFSTISTLVEIFEAYKEEIKSTDCELYYALLNFIDMLKTTKGKRLYFKIGFQ